MAYLNKIMTCGSIDDGKSTLIGRILFETGNISEDQEKYLKKINNKFGKSPTGVDYSLLIDGLLDEKKQGITIDLAYKYFIYNSTRYTLIDSPGHKEFTKNVANAASLANIALLIVDINNGLTEQTKKHLEIISSYPNIKKTIVCLNKIDLVKKNMIVSLFKKTKKNINEYVESIEHKVDDIIPISALEGLNVSQNNSQYYKGPSLLESISQTVPMKDKSEKFSLIKIDFVKKKSNFDRIAFAKNFYKGLKEGDEFINFATGEKTVVQKIFVKSQNNIKINKYQNFSFTFKPQISLSEGDLLVSRNTSKLYFTDSINTKIVWTSKEAPVSSKSYLFKFYHKTSTGFFSNKKVNEKKVNDIFNTDIELTSKILLSSVSELYEFSRFLVIDHSTNETLGFGYINFSLDRGRYVIEQKLTNSSSSEELKCLWFTGLPSSGKSTLANEIGKEFSKNNINYYILDGDNLRSTINKDLGFKTEDRFENNRRIAHIAKILFDSGVIPIVSTVSPNRGSRKFARDLFKNSNFIEIHVDASIEECIKRDVKGIYKSNKKVKNITGIHQNYDIPENPEIYIDTEKETIKNSVNRIIKYINV